MKKNYLYLLGLFISFSVCASEEISSVEYENQRAKGGWITLLKKHGCSALTGTIIGTLCSITCVLSEKMVEQNFESSMIPLSWLLFGGLKYAVLASIASDAEEMNVEYNVLTAKAAAFLSDWLIYSYCTMGRKPSL